MMTGLALPSLVGIIAPVALFAGVLYTLNKLNGDSELVVMSAAGVSPGRLLRPLALLSAVVFAIVATIYIQVLPWTFGAIENLTTFIRADFISNFARPGAFSNLELGFVFHYRERTPDGALRGVFMQDRRDPAHVSTYIAEAGKTVEKDGESYLQLSKGVSAATAIRRRYSAMVTFDDYTIDLSQFMQAVSSIKRPRERSTGQLLAPDDKDRADPVLAGHIRSELLDRLASPLYALVAGLIAFAALGEARTTRQGRGLAIGGAILAFIGVRMLGIAATTLTVGVPAAAYFVWGVPVAAGLGALAVIFRRELFSTSAPAPSGKADVMGRTLSLYLADRFARTVIAVFAGVLCPHLRCRPRRNVAPLRGRAEGDRGPHGRALLPSHPDCRRAGPSVRGFVRLDDRLSQPVAQARAGRCARGRRFRLANLWRPRSGHRRAGRSVGRRL